MIDCLADTGLDATVLAGLALVLLLGGAVTIVARRRSKRDEGSGGAGLALVLILGLPLLVLSSLGSGASAAQAAAITQSPATATAAGCPAPVIPTSTPTSTPTLEPTPPPVPVPAIQDDAEVVFETAGIPIHASYRAPASGSTGVPAAVIVVGTGAIDRNGDAAGLPIEVYRWMADRLSEQGIASIRYDKVGTGATGIGPYAADPDALLDLPFDTVRVQPARDALSFLAAQPGIDASKLIVVGHSEGGTTALALADDPGDGPVPAGLALIEPGFTFFLDIVRPQISEQVAAAVAAGVVAPADGDVLVDWMDDGIAQIRAGEPPYPELGPVPLPDAVDETALLQTAILTNFYGSDPLQTVVAHSYRTLYGKGVDAIDVAAIAGTITVPTLITCGTEDFNTPCGDGTPGSGVKALAASFAPGVARFAELPDTVHVMRDVGPDGPTQLPLQLAYPFSTVAAEELGAFVASFR